MPESSRDLRPSSHAEQSGRYEVAEQLLFSEGLTRYLQTFREHQVDDAILASLTETDLKALGIDLVGHRRKIMVAIEKRRHLNIIVQTDPSLELEDTIIALGKQIRPADLTKVDQEARNRRVERVLIAGTGSLASGLFVLERTTHPAPFTQAAVDFALHPVARVVGSLMPVIAGAFVLFFCLGLTKRFRP